MKKGLRFLLITVFGLFLYTFLIGGFMSISVFAADYEEACNVNDRYFLALKPWDAGLDHNAPPDCSVKFDKLDPDDETSTKFVWIIILNIVYDLFVSVGTIAVVFIIISGYLFLTSAGDPGKAAKARKSLTSAIAGTLIALSSSILVNTLSEFIKPSTDASDVLNSGLNLAFAVVGTIATGFIVYGGLTYVTSTGDPGKAKRGRQILIYAIIGVIVTLLAAAITNFAIGTIE